jgi:ABC-type histidine transport system ATPase subunit
MKRSPGTRTHSQNSTPEEKLIAMLEKLIAMLERQIVELQRSNTKLLRMVEMVMEERFYRPTITGGVRQNVQTSALPLESLSDVAVFDEQADAAQSNQEAELYRELESIATEHRSWRAGKGLADEDEVSAATAA